ncbi:MAG TPA: hypothetical protein VJQ47_00915 [Steroidobacteraceae bacterium]|nr:hypothetical protein [Steroidobacteraceae bacterium]
MKADSSKGMPGTRLPEQEFKRRFLDQYIDPAFDSLRAELERIAAAAWDGYRESRKSPRTRKAGPCFYDPDYELADDWLEASAAIGTSQSQHDDVGGPDRFLVINVWMNEIYPMWVVRTRHSDCHTRPVLRERLHEAVVGAVTPSGV